MADKSEIGGELRLGNGVALHEPRHEPLGIRAVSFAPDGSVTAQMADGATLPVALPAGWRVQVLHSAMVWEHSCGAFVLGAPHCNACDA